MSNQVLCGVDIGGTKLSIGLVDSEGRLIDSVTMHDHVSREPDEIVVQVAQAIRLLLDQSGLTEERLRGIGVGTAGHLRYRDGTIITMSNLKGFRGYPLRSRLQSHFRAPVFVDNDANAQAFGELKYGAGVGYSTLIFMTVSTQIGAGIIIDGRLYRGMTGTAGELGHTIVEPSSDQVCPCGNRGCLISVASGVALPAAARRLVESGERSPLYGGDRFDWAQVTGEYVKRGLDAGDAVSTAIVREFADYIGIGVYNIFQIFNPQAIVLGGGLMSWGEIFFEGIKIRFNTLVREMLYDEIAILRARIGAHSGIIGAASLVLEET